MKYLSIAIFVIGLLFMSATIWVTNILLTICASIACIMTIIGVVMLSYCAIIGDFGETGSEY